MSKKTILAICLTLVLLLTGCKNRGTGQVRTQRAFGMPAIPAMLTEQNRRLDYILKHYWDDFFTGDWTTDSEHVRGIKDSELEQALSNYLGFVMMLPVDKGQEQIRAFFKQIEDKQAEDPDGLFYLRMTEIVSLYLYDPNSPMRSEDLFLPFVQGLAGSSYTAENMLPAYKFQLEKCLVNPYGSVAPDFKFKDIQERVRNLHSIKADFTILFFSNPGCQACLEIINQLGARDYMESMIEEKRLAIVNIYIDNELDKWKEYVGHYPTSWHNCYDYQQVINNDELYFVRAIPSLYLLDKDKRILLKDTPVERVLNILDSVNQ